MSDGNIILSCSKFFPSYLQPCLTYARVAKSTTCNIMLTCSESFLSSL